jgi:hypothetical protein
MIQVKEHSVLSGQEWSVTSYPPGAGVYLTPSNMLVFVGGDNTTFSVPNASRFLAEGPRTSGGISEHALMSLLAVARDPNFKPTP